MAASTTNFPSCKLYFFIVFVLGSNLVLTQDHRFRINVYDYPQEQSQNYQTDRYDDRYRSYQENNDYPDNYQENYQSEDYQQDRQQIYQKNHQQHYQPNRQQHYQQNHHQQYQQNHRQHYEQTYQQNYEPVYEKPLQNKKQKKDEQDFSKIPGVPGVDYPIYHTIPKTSFSCAKVPYLPGMYANVETGCQVYHTCHDGREGDQGAAFLCSNGTLFNQNEFACDWWYNVNCNEALKSYKLNGDATTNPFVPKSKKEEILQERLKIVVF